MTADNAFETVELESLSEQKTGEKLMKDLKIDAIKNVKIKLSVSLGESEMSVGELFDLEENAIVRLDKGSNDPVELVLDGKVVAKGNLVVADEHFGIQITEIAE